jgi:hypothetical protein
MQETIFDRLINGCTSGGKRLKQYPDDWLVRAPDRMYVWRYQAYLGNDRILQNGGGVAKYPSTENQWKGRSLDADFTGRGQCNVPQSRAVLPDDEQSRFIAGVSFIEQDGRQVIDRDWCRVEAAVKEMEHLLY